MSEIAARQIRLKNRRVILGYHEEGWQIAFKRMGDVAKGEKRVHVTSLGLSDAAMRALIQLYLEACRSRHEVDYESKYPNTYTAHVAEGGETLWEAGEGGGAGEG